MLSKLAPTIAKTPVATPICQQKQQEQPTDISSTPAPTPAIRWHHESHRLYPAAFMFVRVRLATAAGSFSEATPLFAPLRLPGTTPSATPVIAPAPRPFAPLSPAPPSPPLLPLSPTPAPFLEAPAPALTPAPAPPPALAPFKGAPLPPAPPTPSAAPAPLALPTITPLVLPAPSAPLRAFLAGLLAASPSPPLASPPLPSPPLPSRLRLPFVDPGRFLAGPSSDSSSSPSPCLPPCPLAAAGRLPFNPRLFPFSTTSPPSTACVAGTGSGVAGTTMSGTGRDGGCGVGAGLARAAVVAGAGVELAGRASVVLRSNPERGALEKRKAVREEGTHPSVTVCMNGFACT